MNKHTYLDVIDQALEELKALRDDIEDGLVPRIRDSWNGHPRSPSFEAGNSPRRPDTDLPDELRGDIDYADPVGRVVAATGARDAAAQDAKTLSHAISTIAAQVRRAGDVRRRHKRRPAAAYDQQQVIADPEPGCDSCARIPGPGSAGMPKSQRVPWFNAVHREVTINGKTWKVCRWCYDGSTLCSYRFTGNLPTEDDLVSYRDTGRVKRRPVPDWLGRPVD